jgi:hypothetical protein
MKDATYTNRIVNGLLKADIGLLTPEGVAQRLSRDVIIRVDPSRSTERDLWPCLWFLASILERQFFGRVFISAGLETPLPCPIPLGPRCVFVDQKFTRDCLQVGIGVHVADGKGIWGDARGSNIAYQALADGLDCATPLSGCTLAGYLGFAALADSSGIPPFHGTWATNWLHLPLLNSSIAAPKKIAILGTGQIGQAFLALAFFLAPKEQMNIHLVDSDVFEIDNYRSQLLLSEDHGRWDGRAKVEHLARICNEWGWSVTEEKVRITWGWKSPLADDAIALLGFDNMESRRVGVEGGFARIVECGVGTNFSRPHISWHSLPPDRNLAKELFVENQTARSITSRDSDFFRTLRDTPGSCGIVTFENIQASAPSLGALAASYTWIELLNYSSGDTQAISGGAYAWSPLQPIQRDIVAH